MDLVKNIELDLWVRYVDNLPAQDIDSYTTLDVRIGWKPYKSLELSIVGRNLLDSQHPEFKGEILANPFTEIERSIYGKITWRY